jgi:hypothetical protein
MKDIIKMQIMSRGMNYRMTSVVYIHTWTTSCVNLFIAIVVVSYMQIIQFTYDMISCTRIGVPVCVNTIITNGSTNRFFWITITLLKPCPAIKSNVANFATTW